MDYPITQYGAVADGVTNNREAIQSAIDAANEAGGGRVVVPTGRFLTGALVLKSNVTLHLETGAWLIGSLNLADGIDFAAEFDDDTENAGWTGGCFLFARHAENITIEGRGVIYGQGDKVFYDDNADDGLHECPKNVRTPAWERPRTTFFEDVENLTVRDVTFRDAAFWTLHMAGCRHVLVDGVRILNDQRGANNDGIDPDTCRDVVITNCIVKGGDDAIVVKNTPPMAAKYGACENIVISNCVLYSHDSALKIGTETANAIRHVVLSDCVFRDCSRGVGIWVRDGAVIEDIHVHHVSGNTRHFADCPQRDFAPRWWGKGEPIFISATPRVKPSSPLPGVIRDVTFDHIWMTCESGVFIAGEENAVIENVDISDLHLTQRVQGTQKPNLFDEQPSVHGVYEHDIPAVYVRHGRDVRVSGTVRREGEFRGFPLVETESSERVSVDLHER
ncbi:glycoside hydrolase family 28 protein [Bifidobacterium simiarum]|uniref:Glycoside hydrolase n=1 Tax=Bifidobacterium simiarum TaxID=2045441 RepID=A0A2M9HE73_9BIFI|nr:glycosyl hydrolase family 28 protein [Bifidobacterium simiarum]PJM75096.1 glycoside hydrolase [Bifidobacterium simiarum]